jgi:hypothetical protein
MLVQTQEWNTIDQRVAPTALFASAAGYDLRPVQPAVAGWAGGYKSEAWVHGKDGGDLINSSASTTMKLSSS